METDWFIYAIIGVILGVILVCTCVGFYNHVRLYQYEALVATAQV